MIIHVDIVTVMSYVLAVISAIVVGFILKVPLLPERPMRDSWTASIIFPTTVIALGLTAMVIGLGWTGIAVGIIVGILSPFISKYLLEKILPRHTDMIGGESGE